MSSNPTLTAIPKAHRTDVPTISLAWYDRPTILETGGTRTLSPASFNRPEHRSVYEKGRPLSRLGRDTAQLVVQFFGQQLHRRLLQYWRRRIAHRLCPGARSSLRDEDVRGRGGCGRRPQRLPCRLRVGEHHIEGAAVECRLDS